MTSRFTELSIDCHHPPRLAEFWCAVLGYTIIHDEDDYIEIAAREPVEVTIRDGPVPPTLVFQQVSEAKGVKNRLHVDVSPIDRTQVEEVDRLLDLGARHVDIGQGKQSWVVLADPEGNEFCVLRSLYQGQSNSSQRPQSAHG